MIRTVTGKITPGELGRTLIHEHIICTSPDFQFAFPNWLPREKVVPIAVAKLRYLAEKFQLRTFIDATPISLGRDLGLLREVSEKSGVQIILLLVAVNHISPSYYEVADMEGATGWEKLWKVTIPMIAPTILVVIIYTIIDSFTSNSNVVMSYISEKFNVNQVLASAMSWIYFIVIMLIIAAFVGIASAFIFYQKRD